MCADLDTALRVMKTRPGEPQKLTDEQGRTVHGMYFDSRFMFKNYAGGTLSFGDGGQDDARATLSFLTGAVTVELIEGATIEIDETIYRRRM